MEDRAYYTDSYTTEFRAAVMERGRKDGLPFVVLDHTYFYPTSGGQPYDQGMIEGIAVQEVSIRQDDNAVVHILESLPDAEIVTAVVDWARRFDHMQQHSGQHILSQAFIQVADAQTVGFHLSDETVTVDLDQDRLEQDLIDRAENLANQIVWQDRPVVVRWATHQEAASLPLRKIPQNGDQKLRLIDIVDFDLTACGGTHVARTGEVGLIKILKQESRNKKSRIHFCCGGRALTHYRSINEIASQLSAQLTTGTEELPASVAKLQENEKALRRDAKRLQGQLDEFEAQQLLLEASTLGDSKLIVRVFPDGDVNKARSLAKNLTRENNIVVLFAVTGERIHLIFNRAESAPGNMKELLLLALGQLGPGSGGGSDNFAQGAAPFMELQEVNRALDMVTGTLLERTDS